MPSPGQHLYYMQMCSYIGMDLLLGKTALPDLICRAFGTRLPCSLPVWCMHQRKGGVTPMIARSFSKIAFLPGVLALAIMLSGCGGPRFDASSVEAFDESLRKVADESGNDFWTRYDRATGFLFAAKRGWAIPDGEALETTLERVTPESGNQAALDEAIMQFGRDMISQWVQSDEGRQAQADVAYAVLGDEIDGKSADEFFALAEEALPGLRVNFAAFGKGVYDRYAKEVGDLGTRYHALADTFAALELQTSLADPPDLSNDRIVTPESVQPRFSFSLTNGTAKPIDRIVFLRGNDVTGLNFLTYEFYDPVAPGETAEEDNLVVSGTNDFLATVGLPLFVKLRFADGTWFPQEHMDRTAEALIEQHRSAWRNGVDQLNVWRTRFPD